MSLKYSFGIIQNTRKKFILSMMNKELEKNFRKEIK
jgi:hypothetical protein